DSIFLQGGAVFHGRLVIAGDGCSERGLLISSYGCGRAVIITNDSSAVTVRNLNHVIIRDLEVMSRDRTANHGFGIQVVNDLPGAPRLKNVSIENVIAHGFKWAGIYVGGVPTNLPGFVAPAGCRYGFEKVRIENCVAYDNVYYGIYVSAPWSQYAELTDYGNADVVIRDCAAYDNPGDPTFTENHSGSGIMLDDTAGGLIEYCVAYRNGALNAGRNGGPVGIWTHASTRVTIQYCESFSNRTGGAADGGGFDLDGGVSRSVIQYCYSHDNDGAGFLIWEWGGVRQLEQDTVRWCISVNDGRRHTYGAVHIGTSWKSVRDIVIHNNTLLMNQAPNGEPCVVWISGKTNERIHVCNNLMVSFDGIPLVNIRARQKELRFLGNGYWVNDGRFVFKQGNKTFSSFADWRRATGMETLQGRTTAVIADPGFDPYRIGETVGYPRRLCNLKSCRLSGDSPFCRAGLSFFELKISPAPFDFWGTPTPANLPPSIGAWQCP
ncbi:MAG: right-handed parallel beta-helix repeat-containing protein, partial [candidate division KSB1 bacterium]|nr:right-handed parallel beta-helix repeat-containing protein [candidate division KSB1 bacterium]